MKKLILFFVLILALSGCISQESNSKELATLSDTKEIQTKDISLTSLQVSKEKADASSFSLPLAKISEKAKFYEYKLNGVTIKFFAMKASNGSVRTAFDACDVCYKSKKGYRQEGNKMICNNCGLAFPVDMLGTKRGKGCWPGNLVHKIERDNVIIENSEIESGRWRFE